MPEAEARQLELPARLRRHALLLASAGVLAAAALLFSFQPLRSPWWSGFDFDSVYGASGLTLFGGERTVFFDHPGLPLQEGLAATFTGVWAVSSPGEGRHERAQRWLQDLDAARPVFRAWGGVLFAGSALLVLLALAALTGSAGWGLLGALLFLGAPDSIGWANVVRPDAILAAVCVASVALVAIGYRRGSYALYLAAAALSGFALSLKLPGIGLLVPLAVAVLLRRPPPGWAGTARRELARFARRRRRPLLALGGAWLVLAVVLNALGPAPDWRHVRDLVAALAAAAVAASLVWLLVRRTRVGPTAELALLGAGAYVAGLLVPNLLYASTPATMVRFVGRELLGRDATASSQLFAGGYDILWPWLPFLVLAAVGLVLALRAGDRTSLLWATAALTAFVLAATQEAQLRYYDPAVALTIPLVLAALRAVPRYTAAVAVAAVAALLAVPVKDGIQEADRRGDAAARSDRLNRWVDARLRPGEVVLTRDESSDSRYFYVVRAFAPGFEHRYRFLTADSAGIRYAREQGLRVRYVIASADQDPATLPAVLGLEASARRAGPPGVFEIVG